jgi:hypothetical protein
MHPSQFPGVIVMVWVVFAPGSKGCELKYANARLRELM